MLKAKRARDRAYQSAQSKVLHVPVNVRRNHRKDPHRAPSPYTQNSVSDYTFGVEPLLSQTSAEDQSVSVDGSQYVPPTAASENSLGLYYLPEESAQGDDDIQLTEMTEAEPHEPSVSESDSEDTLVPPTDESSQ